MRSLVEISLETIDSTQTYARAHRAEWGPSQLAVITAEHQAAGHGRFQRPWVSQKGTNLLVTLAFQTQAKELGSLAQLLALVLAHTLTVPVLLKWPNDLLLSGKKLAGVLCEVDGPYVALGFGLNVNQTQFPIPATSLQLETGHAWDRAHLLRSILAQFLPDLERFEREGFAPFRASFERHLAYKGEKIRLTDGARIWEGICHSLADDGRLNLQLASGEIKTFASGEVTTAV